MRSIYIENISVYKKDTRVISLTKLFLLNKLFSILLFFSIRLKKKLNHKIDDATTAPMTKNFTVNCSKISSSIAEMIHVTNNSRIIQNPQKLHQ